MKHEDFVRFAKNLVGEEVQVVTYVGTYTGKLKFVGSDILVVSTFLNGRKNKVAIRIALIVAILKLRHLGYERRGPFWGAGAGQEQTESSSIKESSSFKW